MSDLGNDTLLAGDFVDDMVGLLKHLAARRERIAQTLAVIDETEATLRKYLAHFQSDWAARDAQVRKPLRRPRLVRA